MKKTISKSIILVGMAFMFAMSLFFGISTMSIHSASADLDTIEELDTDTILGAIGKLNTDTITVEACDSSGTELGVDANSPKDKINLSTSQSTLSGQELKVYEWENVHHFKITLNHDNLTSTTDENAQTNENAQYNYLFTVTWTPDSFNSDKNTAYLDTDRTQQCEITRGEVSNKDDIPTTIYLTVDDNTIESTSNVFIGNDILGDAYKKHGGYGMYVFSFKITNADPKSSQVFELTPKSVEGLPVPIITADDTTPSKGSILKKYVFKLDGDYKYVDRNLLYWSITGTGKDGRSYVLTPDDISNSNTTNSIFKDKAVERNGPTFEFEPNIEGTWQATCTVSNPDKSTKYVAYSGKVSTVKGLSSQSLLWIVAGAAAAAVIIVAVVIIVSIKREKVY